VKTEANERRFLPMKAVFVALLFTTSCGSSEAPGGGGGSVGAAGSAGGTPGASTGSGGATGGASSGAGGGNTGGSATGGASPGAGGGGGNTGGSAAGGASSGGGGGGGNTGGGATGGASSGAGGGGGSTGGSAGLRDSGAPDVSGPTTDASDARAADSPAPESGGDGGSIRTTRWLLTAKSSGTYAYNLGMFPSPGPGATIDSHNVLQGLSWSPDTKSILYNSAGLFIRDMSGDVPGVPVLLASLPAGPAYFGWSADSKSVAFIGNNGQLLGLDPSEIVPTLHPIANGVRDYAWGPLGAKLAFSDPSGTYLIDVNAGNPGTRVGLNLPMLDAGVVSSCVAFKWSPDGRWLACQASGRIFLTDLGGATPVSKIVQMPGATTAPSVSNLQFSSDGALLAFSAVQNRTVPDIYYVATADPALAAILVTAGAAPGETARYYYWNQDFPLLAYILESTTLTQRYFAVALSGTTVGQAIPLPTPSNLPGGSPSLLWIPRSPAMITWNATASGLVLFDPTQPSPQPVPLAEPDAGMSGYYAVTVDGAYFAFGSGTTLDILSLQDRSRGSSTPLPGTMSTVILPLVWSPDSKFLALMTRSPTMSTNFPVYLVRVDGVNTSSPILLMTTDSFGVPFEWQP
jgi:WD40 repeat protein